MTEPDDIRELRRAVEGLRIAVDARFDLLTQQVTRLMTLSETEAARCPYQVTIAKASNNRTRLSALEKVVYGGGGMIGVGIGVKELIELGRAAGWF